MFGNVVSLLLHIGVLCLSIGGADDVPDVGVICRAAQGKKCQRCWTLNLPMDNMESDLCDRCKQVVN